VFCGEQLPLASRSSVAWVDCDFQTMFGGEHLPFAWSVSGPICVLGCSDCVLCCASAFWLVGQRSDGRIGIFRTCFVVYSSLLFGLSAVR
jgi:hypothetical protein